jgi:hypothetical protein
MTDMLPLGFVSEFDSLAYPPMPVDPADCVAPEIV